MLPIFAVYLRRCGGSRLLPAKKAASRVVVVSGPVCSTLGIGHDSYIDATIYLVIEKQCDKKGRQVHSIHVQLIRPINLNRNDSCVVKTSYIILRMQSSVGHLQRGGSFATSLGYCWVLVVTCIRDRWRGGGCTHVMHDRSPMTVEPRGGTVPGRSTSGSTDQADIGCTSMLCVVLRTGGG